MLFALLSVQYTFKREWRILLMCYVEQPNFEVWICNFDPLQVQMSFVGVLVLRRPCKHKCSTFQRKHLGLLCLIQTKVKLLECHWFWLQHFSLIDSSQGQVTSFLDKDKRDCLCNVKIASLIKHSSTCSQ